MWETVTGPKRTCSDNNSEVCIHSFVIKILSVELIVTRAPSTEDPQKRKYDLVQGYVLQNYCTLQDMKYAC